MDKYNILNRLIRGGRYSYNNAVFNNEKNCFKVGLVLKESIVNYINDFVHLKDKSIITENNARLETSIYIYKGNFISVDITYNSFLVENLMYTENISDEEAREKADNICKRIKSDVEYYLKEI